MPSNKRWLAIVLGIVGVVVCLGIGIFAAGAYFMFQHMRVELTSPAAAQEEFEAIAGRFAGQQPLIEIPDEGDENDDIKVHFDPKRPKGVRLESLNLLIWDPRVHKLVHLNVPFWLIRMAPHGALHFRDADFNADRLHLTVEDLERRGPGLVLDHTERRGTRVLVWTQ